VDNWLAGREGRKGHASRVLSPHVLIKKPGNAKGTLVLCMCACSGEEGDYAGRGSGNKVVLVSQGR
jgi:hypothetical protein